MAEKKYFWSVFQVKCSCGFVQTVRTHEREKKESCWNCHRGIKIILGYGANNYRVYIVDGTQETQVHPLHVDQKE